MSFLKDFFDTLIGPPVAGESNSLWSSLAGETGTLNLNGVSNLDQSTPEFFQSNRRAPIEEISAVIQNRYRAFNVIEINPWLLDATNYGCRTTLSNIYQKIGYNLDTDPAFVANTGTSRGWRTVEIACAGTYLKFEFLNGLVNFPIAGMSGTLTTGTPSPDNFNKINYGMPPLATASTPGIPFPDRQFSRFTSTQNIFIQFDDPSSALILIKPGDVIKVPFERFFVTCQQYVPKFNITTGYNASIEVNPSYREMNAKPAYGPGHGLWDSPSRHCTPWTFTPNGLGGPSVIASNTISLSGSGTQTDTRDIFNLQNTNPIPCGVAVGWINSINIAGYYAEASGSPVDLVVGRGFLYIWTANFLDQETKLICAVPFNAATGLNTGAAGNRYQSFNINVDFNEARRFSLEGANSGQDGTLLLTQNCKLKCTINSSATATALNVMYAINGYLYGQAFPAAKTVTTAGSGAPTDVITACPFPLDLTNS